MSSESLHESREQLTVQTQDQHRAIVSLMEELEAVDWYQQRVEGASDSELKKILAHNRDEEIEHAAMVLEWLRRRVPKFDEELRTYLFTEGPIDCIETAAMSGESGAAGADRAGGPKAKGFVESLGIGSLKGAGR